MNLTGIHVRVCACVCVCVCGVGGGGIHMLRNERVMTYKIFT